LRKSSVMLAFLEDQSLEVFEKWLDQMPDGTYPNNNLVAKLMAIMDKMDVHHEHLKDNKCHQLVQLYTDQRMGNADIRAVARKICAKWDRIKYAGVGRDEDAGYETFQKRIKGSVGMASEVQRKPRIGVILPQRNAFDFSVAPDSHRGGDQQKSESMAKTDIMKTLMKLRKTNTSS